MNCTAGSLSPISSDRSFIVHEQTISVFVFLIFSHPDRGYSLVYFSPGNVDLILFIKTMLLSWLGKTIELIVWTQWRFSLSLGLILYYRCNILTIDTVNNKSSVKIVWIEFDGFLIDGAFSDFALILVRDRYNSFCVLRSNFKCDNVRASITWLWNMPHKIFVSTDRSYALLTFSMRNRLLFLTYRLQTETECDNQAK